MRSSVRIRQPCSLLLQRSLFPRYHLPTISIISHASAVQHLVLLVPVSTCYSLVTASCRPFGCITITKDIIHSPFTLHARHRPPGLLRVFRIQALLVPSRRSTFISAKHQQSNNVDIWLLDVSQRGRNLEEFLSCSNITFLLRVPPLIAKLHEAFLRRLLT